MWLHNFTRRQVITLDVLNDLIIVAIVIIDKSGNLFLPAAYWLASDVLHG